MPTLSEVESKRLIARYGVGVLDEQTARDPQAAVAAAERLGFPVFPTSNRRQPPELSRGAGSARIPRRET
jgi:hypothetical protein